MTQKRILVDWDGITMSFDRFSNMIRIRERLTVGLLYILVFVSSFSLFFYGNQAANRIFIILEFALLMFLICVNGFVFDKIILTCLFLCAFSLIITNAFHNGFGASIVFLNVVFSCVVFNNIHIARTSYILLHMIVVLLWMTILLISIKERYTDSEGIVLDYLFLGIRIHKNTYGIMALGCFYHVVCIIDQLSIKHPTKNVMTLLLLILFSILIYKSDCRSAIFSVLVFFLGYICVKKEVLYRHFFSLIIIEIVLSGLFTLFYVNNVVELNIGDVLGRSSLYRLGTWREALNLISKYPIFGSGTDYKMLIYDSAHNTILNILKTIGIVPTVVFTFLFANRLSCTEREKYSRICQIIVVSVMVVSFFESIYVESYLYIPFLLFLLNPYQNNIKRREGSPDCVFIKM